MLSRLSAPAGPFIELRDLKQALRIGFVEDDYRLGLLIASETRRYEDFTGRIMSPTDMELLFDGWCDPLILPVAPIRIVTAVAYLDDNDAEQALASGEWYFVRTEEGGEIRFTDAFTSPVLSGRVQSVMARFSAGYSLTPETGTGADHDLDPVERDRRNVMMLAQRLYDTDEQMSDEEMRHMMATRRIFR